jgi:hypothetical protein
MEIYFNTYDLVKILKQKGFTEEQADGIVDAIVKFYENLATKKDLKEIYYKIIISMSIICSTIVGIIISVLKN